MSTADHEEMCLASGYDRFSAGRRRAGPWGFWNSESVRSERARPDSRKACRQKTEAPHTPKGTLMSPDACQGQARPRKVGAEGVLLRAELTTFPSRRHGMGITPPWSGPRQRNRRGSGFVPSADRMPFSASQRQKVVSLPRSPTSLLIDLQLRGSVRPPPGDDRVDQPPRNLDLVTSSEK